MPGLLTDLCFLIAQAPAAASPKGGNELVGTLIMFAPAMILFYFLMIRPQQKQEKARKRMVEAMKKNDRVLTQAGIYGTVVSIQPDSDKVMLRVDDERNVRLEFSRTSIVRVIDAAAEKSKEKDKPIEEV
ncbi:MAG: preprotein translocase subunit YajC [Isosphaeraceae bacterium]